MIFGGYGAVGREAAAVLAPAHDVVVAGRDPSATVPGTTTLRVDLRGDVDHALDGADVVLMCAEVDNARIARACLERGVHYLDVTASRGTIAEIEALEGDATALLSVGLAPGVTNLLARRCVELTGAREVGIGVLLGGGERHGAAAVEWTLRGLADLGPSWQVEFPAPYGSRTVHGFPFPDQHTLRGTLDVDRVRTGLCLDSRLVTALLPTAARFAHRLGPLARAHVGGDGFAVAVSAGGVTCGFSGRRQSRATGVVAALLVDRLPALRTASGTSSRSWSRSGSWRKSPPTASGSTYRLRCSAMAPRRAAALRDGDVSLRDHLIAAATRLIAERGTAGLTVREIARAADVAVGVLYNHFADKEELLALALHEHVRDVERHIGRPATDGTLAENLRAFVTHALAVHAAFLPAFAGLLGQPEVFARFEALPNPMADGRGLHAALADYLRTEQERGHVSADADLDAVATLVVGACHELLLPRVYRGLTDPVDVPPAHVDALVSTVLNGITPR